MMKKIFFINLLAIFFTSVNAALPVNVIDLSLGKGGLQTPNANILTNTSVNQNHSIGGVAYGIGLIHFLPESLMRLPDETRIGIEGNYSHYADNTYSIFGNIRDTYQSYALSALALLQYQFPQHWLLTGKLGVARVTQTLKTSYSTQTLSQFHPEFQIDAGYAFNKHINSSIFYDHILGDASQIGNNDKTAPITTYGVNLNILF
jgi:hypothetical protein